MTSTSKTRPETTAPAKGESPSAMSPTRELEMKYAVANRGLTENMADMLHGMDMRFEPGCERIVRDVYMDTEDWWLYRAGVVCRLRNDNGAVSLELKTLAPLNEGMGARSEFQERLPQWPAELAGRIPGHRIRKWVEAVNPGCQVAPRVQLMQHRKVFVVETPDRGRLEAYADQVRVNDAADFAEIEFELKSGDAQAFERLVREFGARYGLQAEKRSKFERAVSMANLELPSPCPPEATVLQPGDRFIDAAYRVLQRNLNRLVWDEPGTRLGADPERLHDMRVAVRRMRSALRVFGKALPERRVTSLNAELKWLAGALGDVRDLDVYLENLRLRRDAMDEGLRPSLDLYIACQREIREKARRRLLEVLGTKRFERFLSRLREFLRNGPPKRPVAPVAAEPVLVVAPKLIEKRLKRALKGLKRTGRDSPDAGLHALRIQCKRLRYTCEFFADLYGQPVRKLIRRVKKLQDVLGRHQDACVAQEMVGDFLATARLSRANLRTTCAALGQLMLMERQTALRMRTAYGKARRGFLRKKDYSALLKCMRKALWRHMGLKGVQSQ